jgi:hypothetical protein
MADMEIILPIPKGPTRWRRNLKGLSYERGLLKSAKHHGASPFKIDLSKDTTFSQKKSRWTVPLKQYQTLETVSLTAGIECFVISRAQ